MVHERRGGAAGWRRRAGWPSALVAALVMSLAACGSEAADRADAVSEDVEPTEQQELITVNVASLTFPSAVAPLPPLIQEHGIDERHGIELEYEAFGDIGAYYAATTTGAVDAAVGGPTVIQGLVAEGADIQIVSSLIGLKPEVVVTTDAAIESVEDLAGRSLAATVASAQFSVLSIYAASLGVDLTTDVQLVNASLADVRSQLEAGRVDAGLLWEPAAAPALAANDDWRVIYEADSAWMDLTEEKGWELVWAMNRSFVEDNRGVVESFVAMMQEAVELMFEDPEAAGRAMEEAAGMPADVFVSVLEEGRMDYDVRPAWDSDIMSNLDVMFDMAVEQGVTEELPSEDIIYTPES